MSLLVMGTIALDDVQTPSGKRNNMLGGSAAHFALSASCFTAVHLVGVVGRDFPKQHLSLFKKRKINTTSLLKAKDASFHWKGKYAAGDMNTAVTLATQLGVLQTYVPAIQKYQQRIPCVFLANYAPQVQLQALSLMKKPRLIGLDSMNLWIHHEKKALLKLMKRVDIFYANDGEARSLTGEYHLIKAAKALRRLGPDMVVIKKGEYGAMVESAKYSFSFPAYPVERVVDPTGAGDSFAGGMFGYLAEQKKFSLKTLKDAVLFGTTVASFNVEGFGVDRTAGLNRQKINQRKKCLIKYISPTQHRRF